MDDSVRSGQGRIPPGQYTTDKWPVLSYGSTPALEDDHHLRIFGLVEQVIEIPLEELKGLPPFEITADFHCVTRFSTLDNRWLGASTKKVLERAGISNQATHIMAHCIGGYTTNLPIEDFLSDRALLAWQHNEAPLEPDHGGPLRLVVPHLYAWKSAKWLSGLELMDEDRRGFWEANGYHTYGDPWREERFSSQETRHAYQVRRKLAPP